MRDDGYSVDGPRVLMHKGALESMVDNRLLNGKAIRDRILDDVAARVRRAASTHPIGRLVSINIGDNKEAAIYVRAQANAAKKVGLRFEDARWPAILTQEECKTRIVAMNDDADVLGVSLQRPVPKHIHGRSLASRASTVPSSCSATTLRPLPSWPTAWWW